MSSELLLQQLQGVIPGAKLKPQSPPLLSSLSLLLIDPDIHQERFEQMAINLIMQEPPYWSFCWAAGQVLAAYLLQHPRVVRDKVVVDWGSGSGVVAIAAAKAGARRVVAVDIDPLSRQAIAVNAMLNGVHLDIQTSYEGIDADILVAADVLYDFDNHDYPCEWRSQFGETWLADSRIKQFPDSNYQLVHRALAETWPDLDESEEFRQVRLYRWQQP